MTYGMPTVGDMYAGAGGFSHGFLQAGYDAIWACEWDHNACQTYRLNHPNTVVTEGDINKLEPGRYMSPNILIGGPPCQSFSMAGQRGQLSDPRGQNVITFTKWVDDLQPDIFIMENVTGMLTAEDEHGTPVPDIVCREFRKSGYQVTYKVLNAADYGVPQTRRRVFFIGNRLGRANLFPPPTHSKHKGQRTLLGPPLKPWATLHDIGIDEIVVGRSTYNAEDSENQWRHPHEPAPTAMTGPHYTVNEQGERQRWLKPSEMSRIQSFPEDFRFAGSSMVTQNKQIGNAVPPLLARRIAEAVRGMLE